MQVSTNQHVSTIPEAQPDPDAHAFLSEILCWLTQKALWDIWRSPCMGRGLDRAAKGNGLRIPPLPCSAMSSSHISKRCPLRCFIRNLAASLEHTPNLEAELIWVFLSNDTVSSGWSQAPEEKLEKNFGRYMIAWGSLRSRRSPSSLLVWV